MRKILVAFFFLVDLAVQAQDKPKLVVGIVVDQMRQEYLYRFDKKFGAGGFKRLINDGYMLGNTHYNYIPTYTGPGHASVYTGSTPAFHGIISNDWYDRSFKKMVNCVLDDRQTLVGSTSDRRAASPWRLLSSTITDELKMATQKKAKVIGLSLKDRSAILPAGHMADGAYWFDSESGNFISSSYYKPGLPQWLEKLNTLKLADQYLNREWKTLLPIDQYTESNVDDTPYETKLKGKDTRPTFPYNLKEIRKNYKDFDLIVTTPFGNDLLIDLVKAALEGEEMGKDEVTDFLAVSFSSTDYIGHAMGPNSIEIEDTYIRLDKNIEDLLNELDKKVGAGQYLVFLTSDHAVGDVPQYLIDNKIPGGVFNHMALESGLNDFLKTYYPDKVIVENISNNQVFLNQAAFGGDMKSSSIEMLVATELITKYLLSTPGVADVYSASVIHASDYTERGLKGAVMRGYHRKRSGDLAFVLEPGWINWSSVTGTNHGSYYPTDTHIPALFYGWGITKGKSFEFHSITDIAPTISALLKIKFPNGCIGLPATEIVK